MFENDWAVLGLASALAAVIGSGLAFLTGVEIGSGAPVGLKRLPAHYRSQSCGQQSQPSNTATQGPLAVWEATVRVEFLYWASQWLIGLVFLDLML
jgi:hypothetical protein